jgi:hypothetical protein
MDTSIVSQRGVILSVLDKHDIPCAKIGSSLSRYVELRTHELNATVMQELISAGVNKIIASDNNYNTKHVLVLHF